MGFLVINVGDRVLADNDRVELTTAIFRTERPRVAYGNVLVVQADFLGGQERPGLNSGDDCGLNRASDE